MRNKIKSVLIRFIAKLIRHFFEICGPFYIKIGQMLSTRTDLLPKEITEELSLLQDKTKSMKLKEVSKIIAAELEGNTQIQLKEFNTTPIASASIAQVHEAKLENGTKVAVKIRKSNVVWKMKANALFFNLMIHSVHIIATLFNLPVKNLDLPGRYKEICTLMMTQLSMKHEAQNIQLMANAFDHFPFVKIPQVYPELSTDEILIMEYIDAIPFNRFQEVDLEPAMIARRLQFAWYWMLYISGVAHIDLHPGNIFLSKNGDLIFIDFGLVTVLNEKRKEAIGAFFNSALHHEWDVAFEYFCDHFVVSENPDLRTNKQFRQDLTDVFKLHYQIKRADWSTVEYTRDLNKTLTLHQARYSPDFADIETGMGVIEGNAHTLGLSGLDLWENAKRFSSYFMPVLLEEQTEFFDKKFSELTPKSMEMKQRASHSVVLHLTDDTFFFKDRYLPYFVGADGCKLYDLDGNTYIDTTCGLGPVFAGYNIQIVNDAVTNVISQGGNLIAVNHSPAHDLASIIIKAFQQNEDDDLLVAFSDSGTIAGEHAKKIAIGYTGKKKIVKFECHYNGNSVWGSASSFFSHGGTTEQPEAVASCIGSNHAFLDDLLVLQYGHENTFSVLSEHHEEIAAVFIEPIPETKFGDKEITFLKRLRQICSEKGILLVFDEVVTGFRVAFGGAQSIAGITPDLTMLGKIIGGGYPIGAVVGKRDIMKISKGSGNPNIDRKKRVFLGGTFSANKVSCQAGNALLNHLYHNKEEIYSNLEENTQSLVRQLNQVASKFNVPATIEGYRGLVSISFSYREGSYARDAFFGSMYSANIALSYLMRLQGVLLPAAHIFFIGPAHKQDDLTQIVKAFETSLNELIRLDFFID